MADDKRQKIIESALHLFEEKGYHATKVSDIVRNAGIAQGTFYLYFKGKEDLFRGVAEACLDEIAFALAQGSSKATDNGQERVMYGIIRETLRIYYHNRTILSIMNRNGAASPEIADICKLFYDKMAGQIKEILQNINAYPGYSEEQLEMTAYAKIGMVERAAYEWFLERKHGLEQLELLTEVLVGIKMNYKAGEDAGC